jgi:hypothetical protein
LDYANEAMLKVLNEMNRLSSFHTDAIEPDVSFMMQRDLITDTFSQKLLQKYSIESVEEESPRTSLIELVKDTNSKLTKKWRKFVVPNSSNPMSLSKPNFLIQVHQRQIEFKEKPCEMVYIANRSADLKLFNKKSLQIADLETDIKFLKMLREEQASIVQKITKVTVNYAPDDESISGLRKAYESSLRLLCKTSDKLDSLVPDLEPSPENHLDVRLMLSNVKKMIKHLSQVVDTNYDDSVDFNVPATMNVDGQRVM